MSLSARSTRTVPGMDSHGPGQLADRRRPGADLRVEQVAQVEEADHVVGRLPHHRIARVRRLDHLADGTMCRHVTGQEVDLGTRHHHLAERALAGGEDVVDDLPLLVAEMVVEPLTMARISSSLTSSRPARVAAQQPDEDVGRGAEEPDHRAERSWR